jgi:hypothetical protein
VSKHLIKLLICSEEDSSQPHIYNPAAKTNGAKRRPPTKSLELPLIVALGVSPICLLLPMAISGKSVAKEGIYKVSSPGRFRLPCVLKNFPRSGRD